MLTNINGWQRLGIVVSVLWIIGAALFQRTSDVDRAQDFMNETYQTCIDLKKQHNDFNFGPCMDEAEKNYAIFVKDSWGNVAFTALAPIPIGWLLAYTVIGIFRWVRRGFHTPNDLSR